MSMHEFILSQDFNWHDASGSGNYAYGQDGYPEFHRADIRWCERVWTAVSTSARNGRSIYQFFLEAINATCTDNPYPKLIPATV